MAMMPKVSVILTSYNHADYIAQAIESVLNQSFTDFELFIGDDGSTDNSQEIIEGYKDNRIITVLREKNQCGGWATEFLPLCKGQYIAVHHSDDVWELDKLQKQVEHLDTHPETIACFTHVQIIDETGRDYTPPESHFYRNVFDQPNRNRFEWLRFFWERSNALCHPSVLIRKEVYTDCNLFNWGLRQIPDFLKWIRICFAGEIHVIQEKLTKFRLHAATEANTSGDNLSNHIRVNSEYFFICDDLFKVSNEDAFSKVFPEYDSQNVFPEFVVSRLMIESTLPPKQLYGLRKLYKLLNNTETALKIKQLHSYTYADFMKDTEKHDVFSMKSKLRTIYASLFVDYGQGFNETDKLTETVYIRQSGFFSVKYTLADERDVINLRFDPDEGSCWDVSLDSVSIDGVVCQANALNFFSQTDDYDSFLTTDPIYIISAPRRVKEVEISGRVRPLSVGVVYAIREDNEKLQSETVRLKSENIWLQGENTRQQNENARLQGEIVMLQNESNELTQRINDLAKQSDALTLQVDSLEYQIRDIYSSKSWKIGKKITGVYRFFIPHKG
jgi:glycosyltransferase involved in cell wall biosynthesis